jgi:hypothetical protein
MTAEPNNINAIAKFMKRNISLVIMLSLAVLPAAHGLCAEPGEVDFGTFTPSKGGREFVEVHVPTSLISLASKLVEKHEPDVAKLLAGIKQVKVNVIGLDDSNVEEFQQRAARIRTDLSARGWERIVTAQNQGQDVGVYLKMDKDSTIQGISVVVIEGGRQAVFANVVGNVTPEQLITIGDKLNLEPLKKAGEATQK